MWQWPDVNLLCGCRQQLRSLRPSHCRRVWRACGVPQVWDSTGGVLAELVGHTAIVYCVAAVDAPAVAGESSSMVRVPGIQRERGGWLRFLARVGVSRGCGRDRCREVAAESMAGGQVVGAIPCSATPSPSWSLSVILRSPPSLPPNTRWRCAAGLGQ